MDFNPPLYYLVLHFWMKIFGSSEITMRLVSLIFFWLTAYLFLLFLTNIFQIKISKSFLYLLLFFTNPIFVYYAFEARGYTMFGFFTLLSFYSFFTKKDLWYFLATIGGLYTHYFMIFVWLIQFLIARSRRQMICFLAFLPWLVFLFFKGFSIESFWLAPVKLEEITGLFAKIYLGHEKKIDLFSPISYFSLVISFVILSGLFLRFKRRTNKKIFLILFLWSFVLPVIIFLVSVIKPIFFPRYLIFASVGLLLTLVFVVENYPMIMKIAIFIFLLLVNIIYHQVQIPQRQKADLRITIRIIKKVMNSKDYLYVKNILDFFVAQYYLDEKRVYLWQVNYDQIPHFVGKVLIPKEKIAKNLPYYPRRAFILDDNQDFSIQSIK
ncbi:MAG: glycosyltransferase family 39 protein [Patescibacteria group bacterium]|nr:glycosyltransferase family 39 protein [Patescibacteria group bacterium]